MRPATQPRDRRSEARLLVLPAADEATQATTDVPIDAATDAATDAPIDARAADLPRFLRPGDLLVVNDAATLPAALHGVGPSGEAIELRLLGPALGPTPDQTQGQAPSHASIQAQGQTQGSPESTIRSVTRDAATTSPGTDEVWTTVLFGSGDWRTPTEGRPAPPVLVPGDRLRFAPRGGTNGSAPVLLHAEVVRVSAHSPRLVDVRFVERGAAFLSALYALGRPIQYSYLSDDLDLWSVQTVYSARPWAAEMPSAGHPLSWEILLALRKRGVELAWLTHAAGISSSGDADLDRLLPLPERYDLPDLTVAAIDRTRRRGGRVVAVGTTVVRALEGAERQARSMGRPVGSLRAGVGVTDLRLSAQTPLHVVDGLLTGMHGPGESHFDLLSAFAPIDSLHAAWQHATQTGYRCHEFGDLCLLWTRTNPGADAQPAPRAKITSG